MAYHKITKEDILNKNWQKIENQIKQNIKYDTIVKSANTEEELIIARSVKTGLSPLKDDQIKALMNHAYMLTEIQIKLY